MNRILRLPAMTTGRDFVLGDLHGTTDLLRLLREHVAFDPKKDRLFSVGDLIDRERTAPVACPFSLNPGSMPSAATTKT